MRESPPIDLQSLPDPLIILEQIKKLDAEVQELLKKIAKDLTNFMPGYISEISKEAVEVIKAGRIDGNNFFLPPTQLNRKLYEEVNAVIENAGGKWNRSAKAHVFSTDPTLKIKAAIETEKTVDKKKQYQFFETPSDVVDRLLELAEIKYTDDPEQLQDVLEPSAGLGAIADQIDASRCLFRCCELDPEKAKVLMDKGHPVFQGDFLTNKDEEFDRVVMNPPFTKQQDIDHVLHAYSLLRPGGRVVSVMSPGFTFRENKKSTAFKELVNAYGLYEEVPEGAFKESGTNVRTVIVVLNKPVIN